MLPADYVLNGRYHIEAVLGQGGMSVVYRAWDNALQIPVAVKEMVPQPNVSAKALAQLRLQFAQEAQTLAKLQHPNLVSVLDHFELNGNAYLVMRFVEGQSLEAIIQQQGAQPEGQVLDWAKQLLQVLTYCHEQGVIHRDIKPANLMVQANGQIVLVDFGLVKLWDATDAATRTAMMGMGTPEYAPPEQYSMNLGSTDPRTDLYSLGATLYHALTGQAPLAATDRMAAPQAFVKPTALQAGISRRTEGAILRVLSMAQTERFDSAVAMYAALFEEQVGKRPLPIALIGLVTLLALVGAFLWWQQTAVTESIVVAFPTPESEPAESTEPASAELSPVETAVSSATATTKAEPTAELTATPEPTLVPTETLEPTATLPPATSTLTTFTVLATVSRNETGIQIEAGQQITIRYQEGSWRAGPLPTWPWVGAEGDPQVPQKGSFPVPTSQLMTLVAGIGNQAPIPIAQYAEFTATTDGVLWLGANDDGFHDNAGELRISISVAEAASSNTAFTPIALASITNGTFDEPTLPVGEQTWADVPFLISHDIFKTQASAAAFTAFPTEAALSVAVPYATRLHLLLGSGNGFTRFLGDPIGLVVVRCDDEPVELADLVLGQNIREWHSAVNVVSTAPGLTPLWETGGTYSVHLDQLTLDLPASCRTGELTQVEIEDTSATTVQSLDPALNWIGLTVEHEIN
ncbi:MAG: protein kinase [Chloroflexota bacterium]